MTFASERQIASKHEPAPSAGVRTSSAGSPSVIRRARLGENEGGLGAYKVSSVLSKPARWLRHGAGWLEQ